MELQVPVLDVASVSLSARPISTRLYVEMSDTILGTLMLTRLAMLLQSAFHVAAVHIAPPTITFQEPLRIQSTRLARQRAKRRPAQLGEPIVRLEG